MSTDVHETYAELERVRREIATLEHDLERRFVSLYPEDVSNLRELRLAHAREQEAELVKQMAAATTTRRKKPK